MCGLTGFFQLKNPMTEEQLRSVVTRMAETLRHRGPDDHGEWIDARQGVALGFRRLAILDLSAEGHQPMASASGRYVIVFNGEIYNFSDLRRELEARGNRFRGHSDTEVALASFERWGVVQAVTRFNGMFAMAVWDQVDRVLHLVRDRIGKKPLYYGHLEHTFLFGSELKALRRHPAFAGEVDRDALALYLRFGYVPSPHSIYQGISKLPPGCILSFSPDLQRSPIVSQYWSIHEVAERGILEPLDIPIDEAVSQLETLLRDAVRLRMVADVPLGAFLSGGGDSSLVVAMMQSLSSRPVKTFCIGFRESGFDEAAHASIVARHLGTDHSELYVTAREALDTIPSLPVLYDEPFADSSQIPTYLVSQLARRDVTVSLSGDGGDELFGGYGRYVRAAQLWRDFARFPRRLRSAAATALQMTRRPAKSLALASSGPIDRTLPSRRSRQRDVRHLSFGQKLDRITDLLPSDTFQDLYMDLISHWTHPARLVIGATNRSHCVEDQSEAAGRADLMQRMMLLDTATYLPDDILVKVDRATMGVGLEARAPLLDHRLVEFAWRLPTSMKFREGETKWLLRQLLDQYIPPSISRRPKMGFDVPLADWLRGPLRDWAESHVDEQQLNGQGFFNTVLIRQKWREHLSGSRNWQQPLWCVLMFQCWFSEQQKGYEGQR
jgi:asparagine synthase (glutamine-hydrolysing)